MANGNGNKVRNWMAVIVGILTIVGILAGCVRAFGNLGGRLDSHCKVQNEQMAQIYRQATDVRGEGCKPAKQNSGDIKLIEYRLNQIQTTQNTIQRDTKEILSRLPK